MFKKAEVMPNEVDVHYRHVRNLASLRQFKRSMQGSKALEISPFPLPKSTGIPVFQRTWCKSSYKPVLMKYNDRF